MDKHIIKHAIVQNVLFQPVHSVHTVKGCFFEKQTFIFTSTIIQLLLRDAVSLSILISISDNVVLY